MDIAHEKYLNKREKNEKPIKNIYTENNHINLKSKACLSTD